MFYFIGVEFGVSYSMTKISVDLWLAAACALGLLAYLVAVLLRPERF